MICDKVRILHFMSHTATHDVTEALSTLTRDRPLRVSSSRTIVCPCARDVGEHEALQCGFLRHFICPTLTDALTVWASETLAYIEAPQCVAHVCKQVSAWGISGADASQGVDRNSSIATPGGASTAGLVVWIHCASSRYGALP